MRIGLNGLIRLTDENRTKFVLGPDGSEARLIGELEGIGQFGVYAQFLTQTPMGGLNGVLTRAGVAAAAV